jgi:hypothetical protein
MANRMAKGMANGDVSHRFDNGTTLNGQTDGLTNETKTKDYLLRVLNRAGAVRVIPMWNQAVSTPA